jgi:hypothetical protein
MSRFETGEELRKEIEEHLGNLSDEEWASLEPAWSPPYDDADFAELLQEGERLPSRIALRSREFVDDVQRLRRQLLVHNPELGDMTIQMDALVGVETLYQLVKGDAAAEAAAEVGELAPADIASIHSTLGLAVHECLAADWLARRYRVEWVTAMNALSGAEDVAEMRTNEVVKVERFLPRLSSWWAGAMRRFEPIMRPTIKDIERILRRRGDVTKALLRYVLDRRGVSWSRWQDGWSIYEHLASQWNELSVNTSEESEFKRFSSWRHFCVAAKRADADFPAHRDSATPGVNAKAAKRARKGRGPE